jgi:hypothetical protein
MKARTLYLILLLILALFLTACKPEAPAGIRPDSPTAVSHQADPVVPQSSSSSQGSGDFNLADPATGLADLSSYRQSLTIGFEGNVNGEGANTKTSLTREIVSETETELTWMEVSGGPVQFFGRIGALDYAQASPETPCGVAPLTGAAPESAPAAFQLASLPALSGAEAAGEENLNGTQTKKYTFDERAIGYADQAKATGEVWVAEPGGYVLRYTLRLEAPTDLLGPGVSGVQTWSYELSEINTGKTSLPESCQGSQDMGEIPMVEGAELTYSQPGYQVYQASASLDTAVAFYQAQAEALGWKAEEPYEFGGKTRLALRLVDGSLIQLTLEPNGELLNVTVQTLAPLPVE